MDLLKPLKLLAKHSARKYSDNLYNKEKLITQNEVYESVGKDIEKAKENGKYFNPKKKYDNKLKKESTLLEQKKNRRDKIIDDI